MRNFFFTATLFVAVLALIGAASRVRLPDYFQVCGVDPVVPLFIWLFYYVICPVVVAYYCALYLYVIWIGCNALCAKLRGGA